VKDGNLHPYLIARVNPFLAGCNGIRAPDEFGFPTATGVVRIANSMQTDSGGYSARLFLPFLDPYAVNPGSNAGGTISWPAGSTTFAPQNPAFVNMASSYRVVSWGLRITGDDSLTSSKGHVWICHVPLRMNTSLYNGAPTNEAMMASLPLSEKFSVVELAERPIVVAGRPYDDGIYRFRTTNTLSISSDTVESTTGWCGIQVFCIGASNSSTPLNVEVLMHIEYLQSGTDLYGFVDTMSAPYEPQAMIQASRVDSMLPVGVVDSTVDTVEQIASYSSRLMIAGSKLLPVVNAGMKAAGVIRAATGFFKKSYAVPHFDAPRIEYDDEKYF